MYVYWSAVVGGDVSCGVSTRTSTIPVPGGLTVSISVSETTTSARAGALPKTTAVAPLKPYPLITSEWHASGGPEERLSPVTPIPG